MPQTLCNDAYAKVQLPLGQKEWQNSPLKRNPRSRRQPDSIISTGGESAKHRDRWIRNWWWGHYVIAGRDMPSFCLTRVVCVAYRLQEGSGELTELTCLDLICSDTGGTFMTRNRSRSLGQKKAIPPSPKPRSGWREIGDDLKFEERLRLSHVVFMYGETVGEIEVDFLLTHPLWNVVGTMIDFNAGICFVPASMNSMNFEELWVWAWLKRKHRTR